MIISEIPLTPNNQRFRISLGGKVVNMCIQWRGVAGWTLDLTDEAGGAMAYGLPLVPGRDLLGQFRHLGINGMLVVASDVTAEEYPTKDNLGIGSHLYFVEV
ncbi:MULTISPECIES: hypothetical protein [unclassified Serratia (in: enterobacteria)]|uniref:phage baseplate plug family protein n=1 Tax=unclassified Serratia (in: enterobacteria) TaxID=2647522 RepID=UPI0005008C77|nr:MULTISPECIES: hypothetical protein [unclassified Serratia (in: enterobacteria)]KFK93328.1 bacteriophage protein [Serratia sp. Ag2]KFK98329.1 bacteriophage protein [Serratia sp. Ag1]